MSSLPHPVVRAIRQHRLRRQMAAYEPRVHIGTYGDVRLKLRFEDGLAEGWYGRDRAPLQEILLLQELGVLRPGARVFDLGAHQAIVAMEFAGSVAPGGLVIAVEGEPHNARMAEVNRSLNERDDVVVLHAAVTEEGGTVSFAEGLNGHVDRSTNIGNVKVPAITIDELCVRFGVPDLVVLDLEGHEGVALRAAKRASQAAWVIEVHVGQLEGDVEARDIIERFQGWSRWIGGDEGFNPFTGKVPDERFFLIAVPPERMPTSAHP